MPPPPLPPIDPDALYPLLDASQYIVSRHGWTVHPATLAKWRRGGRFTGVLRKIGKRSYYLIYGHEILRLIAERNKSEAPAAGPKQTRKRKR